jgi:hypothetical protein
MSPPSHWCPTGCPHGRRLALQKAQDQANRARANSNPEGGVAGRGLYGQGQVRIDATTFIKQSKGGGGRCATAARVRPAQHIRRRGTLLPLPGRGAMPPAPVQAGVQAAFGGEAQAAEPRRRGSSWWRPHAARRHARPGRGGAAPVSAAAGWRDTAGEAGRVLATGNVIGFG